MTHREALAGIVGALERASGADKTGDRPCPECQCPIEYCDSKPDRACTGRKYRAALSAWKQRGRLRDDEAVMRILRAVEADAIGFTDAADALEAALFGPPTKEGT